MRSPRLSIRVWHVCATLIALSVLVAACGNKTSSTPAQVVAGLHVPNGFSLTIVAQGLQSPRFIAFGPNGALFIAERGSGNVLALSDPTKAGTPIVVASGLHDPTSLSFDGHDLYVGEANQVTQLTIGSDLHATASQVVIHNLPTGGSHTTRTVLVGTDGMLYVAIGSTCNDCIETDTRRATIMQFAHDGSGGRIYAYGLRNSVGLAINPWNGALWATNNGRDNLGDNVPPEVINTIHDGGNYGWPVCHAGDIVDPELGKPNSCVDVTAPVIKMQAHSAPLALAFYQRGPFPDSYHGAFVAFHGSWNRSVPTGYKVVFIPLDARGNPTGPTQDFITGWLQPDGSATQKPVGLAVSADGALYVSTDQGGTIYRVTATGK